MRNEMKWNEWIRRKLSTDFWTMHTNADRERYSHTHTRTCTHLCAWVYERQWETCCFFSFSCYAAVESRRRLNKAKRTLSQLVGLVFVVYSTNRLYCSHQFKRCMRMAYLALTLNVFGVAKATGSTDFIGMKLVPHSKSLYIVWIKTLRFKHGYDERMILVRR